MGSIEERENNKKQIHVVVVSGPAQGHINPLLQFAKHLDHQGLKVTLPIILTNPTNTATTDTHRPLTIDHVTLVPYDGDPDEPENHTSFWERRQTSIRLYLKEFLTRHDPLVSCIVYDSVMTWVVDVVKEFGVLSAAFFTQSCAVNSIYHNVFTGRLVKERLINSSSSLGVVNVLDSSDLPSFVSDRVNYPTYLEFLTDQFKRLDEVDWILANTFDCLELEVKI